MSKNPPNSEATLLTDESGLGSMTVREPTIRREREYAVTADQLEMMSTTTAAARKYLGMGTWLMGIGVGLILEQFFMGVELPPMVKILSWVVGPLLIIVGVMFLWLSRDQSKLGSALKKRILDESKPRLGN